MRKNIALLAAALLLSAGAAWAQAPGPVVAPVTSPQATGSTVQGSSSATQPQTPPPASTTETKGDSKQAPKADKKP